MTKGIEEVHHNHKPIAIILRADVTVSGIKFFTPLSNFFQVGLHNREKGVRIHPHVHKLPKPITVTAMQELLLIQSGKIRLTLFTAGGKKLGKKILRTGDSVLLLSGGHGVDFLESTRMFEIKQGPYPGEASAKLYFP